MTNLSNNTTKHSEDFTRFLKVMNNFKAFYKVSYKKDYMNTISYQNGKVYISNDDFVTETTITETTISGLELMYKQNLRFALVSKKIAWKKMMSGVILIKKEDVMKESLKELTELTNQYIIN
jgi:hypothetical protein